MLILLIILNIIAYLDYYKKEKINLFKLKKNYYL